MEMEIIANLKLLSAILAEAIMAFGLAFLASTIATVITVCIVITGAFVIDFLVKVAGKPAINLANKLMYLSKDKARVCFVAISGLFTVAFFATGTSLL